MTRPDKNCNLFVRAVFFVFLLMAPFCIFVFSSFAEIVEVPVQIEKPLKKKNLENSKVLIDQLYQITKTLDDLDIFVELERLKEQKQGLEGTERIDHLLVILEYYFYLDDLSGMQETINDIDNLSQSTLLNNKQNIKIELFKAYKMVLDGNYELCVETIKEQLFLATKDNDIYLQAMAYEISGAADATIGKNYTALEKLQMALYLLQGDNSKEAGFVRVGVYNTLAFIYTGLNDIEATVNSYILSVEQSKQHDIAFDYGTIFYNVGFILMDDNYLDEAEKFFIDLVDYYGKSSEPSNVMYPYYALAFIYNDREDYKTSLMWAQKANALVGDMPDFQGTLLQLLAEDEAWLGNIDKAKAYLAEVDAYFEKYPHLKDTTWHKRSLRVLAVIAYAEGHYREAMRIYEQFHIEFSMADGRSYRKDVEVLTENLLGRLEGERAEADLLRANMALEGVNLRNQRYMSAIVIFILFCLVGVIIFQMRWSKILNQSKQEAEKASRTKSEFLAQMSHELRTPLNAIIGFSEMMTKEILGKLGNAKYSDYAVLINQSGLHLLRIINDILDISKVESGKLELQETKFNLCELITESVKIMQNRAFKLDVQLVDKTEKINAMIYADRRIIKQVLFNILSNALKFTQKGGLVEISGQVCDDGHIEIDITDNGTGMSENHIKQAMEPFGQVKSVMVQSHEGTGLGLPLVKAFMDMHEGHMEIISNLGEGTTVKLCFPKSRML